MEDCKDKRKRVNLDDSEPELKARRVDSDSGSDSSVSELVRLDSGVDSSESHLSRVDSGDSCLNESAFDPSSARDIPDDIFNILEDTENVPERDLAMQDLDSVIKSFEEEILATGSDSGLTPEPELQTNLGYLLEASDDELGLPPSTVTEPDGVDPGRIGPEGADLTGLLGFEDDIPNYDAFELGTVFTAECGGDDSGAGGFAAADGLFEYSEPSEFLWRSESLQAM